MSDFAVGVGAVDTRKSIGTGFRIKDEGITIDVRSAVVGLRKHAHQSAINRLAAAFGKALGENF